ncbi:hypothetical protein VTK73DRAFT_5459 [Phialemonium thermophilum]|uniref:Uncharacterized protein n=1 Tax=Phialemonium thermophilum TaxID=223376 RepID=A0ABR3V1T1_9PEZI
MQRSWRVVQASERFGAFGVLSPTASKLKKSEPQDLRIRSLGRREGLPPGCFWASLLSY